MPFFRLIGFFSTLTSANFLLFFINIRMSCLNWARNESTLAFFCACWSSSCVLFSVIFVICMLCVPERIDEIDCIYEEIAKLFDSRQQLCLLRWLLCLGLMRLNFTWSNLVGKSMGRVQISLLSIMMDQNAKNTFTISTSSTYCWLAWPDEMMKRGEKRKWFRRRETVAGHGNWCSNILNIFSEDTKGEYNQQRQYSST